MNAAPAAAGCIEVFITPVAASSIRGLPAVTVLLRDLSTQQQLEKMRADFVANASHELRTPLASLTGFIETLQGPGQKRCKGPGQVSRQDAGTGPSHAAPDR